MKHLQLLCAAISCSLATASYAGTACEVKSGAATAALVELYTSEGCSSCPPADRALSDLRRKMGQNAVLIPLALHVSYWNRIGWVDAYSQKSFDARQGQLLERARKRVAYTPQFFVNGGEIRAWDEALPEVIRKINAKPAPLTIALKATPLGTNKLQLEASASAPDTNTEGSLYVAVSESALVTQVLRGENSGLTLKHDDTVRILLGPFELERGQARLYREVELPAGWRREHLQAAAFVQQTNGPGILQAVSTAQCAAARGL